jgi:NADPH-dependent 2,4-dienoyl-CoA reductase/sulfur reductase-like enzyme
LPAKKAKRVIVVGAGPAGLEAANVAAIRGHKVVLYEQNDTIGGQLINAMQAPYKKGFLRLIRYYGNQLKRNGVEVKLGQKADVKTIIAEKPDEIIVAVGARHVIPDIEGVNGKNVCTPVEVFAGSKEVGGKVVIMGGDMINCDVAEFLLWRGKKVTILDESNRIGSDIIRPNRWVVLQRLRDAGAEMITNVKFNKIDSQGVTVLHDGVTQLYPADSVVVQLSFEPITELAEQLEKHFTNVHRIGDCVSPATVTEAIESGIKVGLQV